MHGGKHKNSEIFATTKNITVWFVVNDLPPFFSGAGKNDLLLAENLLSYKFDITFIVRRHKKNPRKENISNIPIIRIGATGTRIFQIYWFIEFLFYLFTGKKKPDVIRFRGFNFFYGCLIKVIKIFRLNIKTIIQPACYGVDDIKTVKNKKLGSFQAKCMLQSDGFFSMNDLIKEEMITEGYSPAKIFSVKNPVNLVKRQGKNIIRKELGIPDESIVFLTVGMICSRKRQVFITEAFCRSIATEKNQRTYLIHVGPLEKDLPKLGRIEKACKINSEENRIKEIIERKNCQGKIILYGYSSDIPGFMGISDFLIHASKNEGEANVINEAMYHQLPIIISDNKIFTPQVPDYCATRFEEDDVVSLSNCIEDAVYSKKLFKEKAKKAKKYIISTRNPSSAANAYAENILKCLFSA